MPGRISLPEPFVVLFVAAAIASAVSCVMFLLAMRKAIESCTPERRELGPDQVWLALLPVFNLIWMYFLVVGVARSVSAELRSRDLTGNLEPALAAGLAWLVLSLFVWVPVVGWLAGLAALVCWIVYWVAIVRCTAKLAPALAVR